MLISIIVRARNEEKWINSCFESIFTQNYGEIEVILVDDGSTDSTREVAQSYGVKIVKYTHKTYNYSKAINLGISHATGSLIALISAHCIPTQPDYLSRMAVNFLNPSVVGVYSKQIATPGSSFLDRRDLESLFRVQKNIQTEDYFFHNASSMIRKSILEKYPFNEEINGIEDRYWAKEVLQEDFNTIVYEPSAVVYHEHGVNQGGDEERAIRICGMLEELKNS